MVTFLVCLVVIGGAVVVIVKTTLQGVTKPATDERVPGSGSVGRPAEVAARAGAFLIPTAGAGSAPARSGRAAPSPVGDRRAAAFLIPTDAPLRAWLPGAAAPLAATPVPAPVEERDPVVAPPAQEPDLIRPEVDRPPAAPAEAAIAVDQPGAGDGAGVAPAAAPSPQGGWPGSVVSAPRAAAVGPVTVAHHVELDDPITWRRGDPAAPSTPAPSTDRAPVAIPDDDPPRPRPARPTAGRRATARLAGALKLVVLLVCVGVLLAAVLAGAVLVIALGLRAAVGT